MKKRDSKLTFGEPVLVTWCDAGGTGGWAHLQDTPPKPVEIQQLGFFMKRTKEALYIFQGLPDEAADGAVLAPSIIPAGCVLKIRRIKI